MALILDNEHGAIEVSMDPGLVEITFIRFDALPHSMEEIKQRVMGGKMSINQARAELGLTPIRGLV